MIWGRYGMVDVSPVRAMHKRATLGLLFHSRPARGRQSAFLFRLDCAFWVIRRYSTEERRSLRMVSRAALVLGVLVTVMVILLPGVMLSNIIILPFQSLAEYFPDTSIRLQTVVSSVKCRPV